MWFRFRLSSDCMRLLGALSSWVLIVFKDGDSASTLDNLFQWLPSLWKRVFHCLVRISFIAIFDHCLFSFCFASLGRAWLISTAPSCWVTADSSEIPVKLLLLTAEQTVSLSLSSCVMYSSPSFILVVFHQPWSSISMSFLYWGVWNETLCLNCTLTNTK